MSTALAVLVAALLSCAPAQTAPERETVVLLHGMGRTRASMAILAQRFKKAGYETLNFPYTQKGTPLDDLSASLAAYIEGHVRTPRYHLVAHSLGNIVIRNALRKSLKPGLGRIVMLAPPNNAVPLAKRLKDNGLYRWITHDSGQKLSEEAFYEGLPVPTVEFGIIAGDRGNNLTSKGPNDGILDVELTKLPGMKDFVTVHHTHSLIMNAKDTFVYAKRFIETGAFE